MSENCSHDCENCKVNCSSKSKESMLLKPHKSSKIKKVIGVVSGKGGVGKSLITSLLSVESRRAGFATAILDADVTGPSIPKAFGLRELAKSNEEGLLPSKTATGISVMSVNLLMKSETDPVIWRGPVIAGAVGQFWTDVAWGEVDYMFVDMPPGTGDVALTVFQSLPISGVIIVTSPQELVGMIVEKAVKMAQLMHIPVLGIVENMSYVLCPDCNKKIYPFGQSRVEDIAGKYGVKLTAKLPIDPALAACCDSGKVEYAEIPKSVTEFFGNLTRL